jgi:PAS domain-containing protein
LGHTDCGVFVSSACPTVVAIIKKYYPDHADKVTDMLSPLLAHAKMLRATYGEDIGIVFAGPCIAKKTESDTHPNLLDLAITFQGLRRWMDSEHGVPRTEASGRDTFIPHEANEGVLYPVDGGMIAGIKANCVVHDTAYMTFSGIDNIGRVLADVDTLKPKTPIFIELLACEGGCVNGPGAASRAGTVAKRFTVINSCQYATAQTPRVPMLDITEDLGIAPVCHTAYTEGEIVGALQSVGKYTKEDELNCGGCGYDACRGFARALLGGIAEMDMCVGYMRLLAHKKANALIRTMPSGVVIVDKTLCIVECNRHFAEMLGQDTSMVFDVKPGLEGAHLKKIAPFYRHFERALKEGVSAFETECRIDEMVINLHVFTIEPHHLVGGIIQDITVPVIHKERIVKKAQDVITRNVETVQKIAYLLGENAADSEVILNSIITSFSSEEATQGADNG